MQLVCVSACMSHGNLPEQLQAAPGVLSAESPVLRRGGCWWRWFCVVSVSLLSRSGRLEDFHAANGSSALAAGRW